MKKICMLPLVLSLFLLVPGCNEQQTDANIESGTSVAVCLALDAWAAKGDAAQAKLAAQLTITNATAALNWFNGNPTPLGTDVQNLLNTVLLKDLDPVMAEAIQLASAVLDAVMPTVPTTALNSKQVGYVKAFLQGCIDGAKAANLNAPAPTAKAPVVKTPAATKPEVKTEDVKAKLPHHGTWVK